MRLLLILALAFGLAGCSRPSSAKHRGAARIGSERPLVVKDPAPNPPLDDGQQQPQQSETPRNTDKATRQETTKTPPRVVIVEEQGSRPVVEAIRRMFEGDPAMARLARNVTITVLGNRVLVEGTVENEAEKQLLQHSLMRLPEVQAVDSELLLGSQGSSR